MKAREVARRHRQSHDQFAQQSPEAFRFGGIRSFRHCLLRSKYQTRIQRRPAPMFCGGRTSSFLRGSCRVRALPSFPMQTDARNPVHSCRTGFRNAACFSFEKMQRRPAPLICGGRTSSFLRGSCRVRALPSFPMQTDARNPVHSCRTGFRNAACFSFEKMQRRPAPLICGGRTSSFLRGSCRVRALPAD